MKSGKYKATNEFIDDINLIWDNCKTYNQEGSVRKNYERNTDLRLLRISLKSQKGWKRSQRSSLRSIFQALDQDI